MPKSIEQQKEVIAKRLKQLRIDNGYVSYQRFAYEHGLDRKHYWRIEENRTNITLNTLLKLLDIHKTSLEEFFKGI